jgi:hypothetical protein
MNLAGASDGILMTMRRVKDVHLMTMRSKYGRDGVAELRSRGQGMRSGVADDDAGGAADEPVRAAACTSRH